MFLYDDKSYMMTKHLIWYSTGEEHILRRVAGAVVVLWDRLPEELRRLILETAGHMSDRTDSRFQGGGLRGEIGAFILRHKGGD